MQTTEITLGEQSSALDRRISHQISQSDRGKIWTSVNNIIDSYESGANTVLALGYVQSGKTTSITALCACAADRGFRVIIAILGSTLLLRDQNRSRVEDYLGLEENNYRWVSISEPNTKRSPKEVTNWLERDRVILIPVLKNPSVINKVATILENIDLSELECLVIDDEADQASLNTKANKEGESSTYSAIKNLRSKLGKHLYVQYTATPYAPLLLQPSDPLMPKHVEFLLPGQGYTGGREFFIEHASDVLRVIPSGDEQKSKGTITELPLSLESALANFFVGAAHLYKSDGESAPISMLIHSSFKNDLQERYHFLVERFIDKYRNSDDLTTGEFADLMIMERAKLYELGIAQLTDLEFWDAVGFVLKESTLWLINSATDVKKIQWNLAPFHILIGGNKLDRGFTVEGLTVTYMNRPSSDQIDTIEQRARAFGYRNSLLPYCQFFATARTIKTLKGIVHTEDDLRANLRDALDEGKSVSQWAHEIGLYLPADTKPSRDSVLPALRNFNPDGDWFAIRKPFTGEKEKAHNLDLMKEIGILGASYQSFQRIDHRVLELPLSELIEQVLEKWAINLSSPGWKHDEILEFLKRKPNKQALSYVMLLDKPETKGEPRQRKWAEDTGFVNLFQGADLQQVNPGIDYLGDRKAPAAVFGEDKVVLQIHHVNRRNFDDDDLYTLAIYIGDERLVKRAHG